MKNMATAAAQMHQYGLGSLALLAIMALLIVAVVMIHINARHRWTEREAILLTDLADVRARLDRVLVFLDVEAQVTIAWGTASGEPDIEGDLSIIAEPAQGNGAAGFAAWLPASEAAGLERSVEALCLRGEAFETYLTTLSGRRLEAVGRAISGRAVLRLRDLAGDRLEIARLRERHGEAIAHINALHALLDALPGPAWVRDASGSLAWVNAALASAVALPDAAAVLADGIELMDPETRLLMASACKAGDVWSGAVPLSILGQSRLMRVIEVPAGTLSAGMAQPEAEPVAESVPLPVADPAPAASDAAHLHVLDQITTAVALFDERRRLVSCNEAWSRLWALESAFLEESPTCSEFLDRLRAAQALPEQADYRQWKSTIISLWRSTGRTEQYWYLPDGRTLRAVFSPGPTGDMAWLFDDVTEQFQLESRYNALMRVQGETLDSLKEGVAVFGTDGRLKLFNPAFAHLCLLDEARLQADRPHIDKIAEQSQSLDIGEAQKWNAIRSMVAGLHDARQSGNFRLMRRDGIILDCSAAPLPDGATLLTFTDVSASVNVEKALKERNQALVEAETLRNDFVHHVSYELRSPLTNIIGFSHLLGEESTGTLNERQHEYTDHIIKSSSALLAIVNDILDLASIDAGAMELALEDVDITAAIAAAASGVQDRLDEASLHLDVIIPEDMGTMRADGKRLRQILFNLLSNATGFSGPGQTITLSAEKQGNDVVFTIADQGRGIPAEVIDTVFDRFRTHTTGSRHRGVGLGLSIVRSFVELHGGSVRIQSSPGEGTRVTCTFPANGLAQGADDAEKTKPESVVTAPAPESQGALSAVA